MDLKVCMTMDMVVAFMDGSNKSKVQTTHENHGPCAVAHGGRVREEKTHDNPGKLQK